jgi:hypothetical protein
LLAGLLIVEGAVEVQIPALAIGHLHMGNGGPGQLYAVWGIGGVLASGVLLALVRWRGYGLALLVGCLSFAVGVGVSGADGVAVALLAMLPAGVGMALVEVGFMALVPRLADDAVAGRMYALSEIAYSGAAGIGALIAPALIHALGRAGKLGGHELRLRVAGRRHLWNDGATGHRPGASLACPRALARCELPLAAAAPRLERLVRGAHSIEVPAGTAVVTAGEPGSDFYVVDDGPVQIEIDADTLVPVARSARSRCCSTFLA